jgi:hypothetical protein
MLRKSRGSIISVVACVLLVGGCDIVSPCPDSLHPAIVLDVVDSISNAPAALGAHGEVAMGGYVAVLLVTSPSVMQLSVELGEPGVHTVTVSKAGYQTWRRSDVRVESGRCGVATTRLTARLQRLGSALRSNRAIGPR